MRICQTAIFIGIAQAVKKCHSQLPSAKIVFVCYPPKHFAKKIFIFHNLRHLFANFPTILTEYAGSLPEHRLYKNA